MENYRKVRSFVVQESDALQPGPIGVSSLIASQHSQSMAPSSQGVSTPKPNPSNLIMVESHSKVNTLVKRLVQYLSTDHHTCITLKARGHAINKAITIAEIAKKKMTRGEAVELSDSHTTFQVDQHNHIFHEKTVDVWEPIIEGLDRQVFLISLYTSIHVNRHVPCIEITLKVE